VDATPQEVSNGGSGLGGWAGAYQMGPAALKLVQANKHPTCDAQLASMSLGQATRFGCYDHEFVIGEVNANKRFWLSDDSEPTGWRLYSDQTHETDDFGNSSGQVVVTKAIGAIPNGCDLSCRNAFKSDVSSNYKEPEPSAPGAPALPTCAQANPPPYCSGPRFSWNANAVASRNLQADPNGNLVTFQNHIHMDPDLSQPVVNMQDHSASSLILSLSFGLPAEATDSTTVVCDFYVDATNGRGELVNGDDSVIGNIVSKVIVHPGEEATCRAHFTRDEYIRFASIAKDMNLDVSVTATAGNGANQVLFEHNKALCTPVGSPDLHAPEFKCEGTTGWYSTVDSVGV